MSVFLHLLSFPPSITFIFRNPPKSSQQLPIYRRDWGFLAPAEDPTQMTAEEDRTTGRIRSARIASAKALLLQREEPDSKTTTGSSGSGSKGYGQHVKSEGDRWQLSSTRNGEQRSTRKGEQRSTRKVEQRSTRKGDRWQLSGTRKGDRQQRTSKGDRRQLSGTR